MDSLTKEGDKDDSELDTTLQANPAISPAPGDRTLTTGDLPLSDDPSPVSSLDLNLGLLNASCGSVSHRNEDPTAGFESGRVAQSTTSAHSSSSSLKETVVDIASSNLEGDSLQQPSSSDVQHESVPYAPQTGVAEEEWKLHRGSDSQCSHAIEAATQSGSASVDTLSTEVSVSPEPNCLPQEEDELQKPFIIQSTPQATGSDMVIHLLPLNEEHSEKELDIAVIEPPSMFAVVTSSDIPQYTIDTESDQEAIENDQEQLLLDLISNSTESKLPSSSPLIADAEDAATIERILSQPQEYSEDEAFESRDSSPVLLRPPKQFDGPPKGASGDDESVTPLASPVAVHRQQEQKEALSTEVDETTPKASPVFVHKVYKRRGTPYTSIEDLPSAVDEDSTVSAKATVIECPPQFASPNLDDLLVVDDEPPSRATSFTRSRSFEHKRQITIHQPDGDASPRSTKSSGRKRGDNTEGSKKFASVLRRAHSFSKSRHIQRPISVIGLVHSTRDNSDLVDLDDAMRYRRQAAGSALPSPRSSEAVLDEQKTPDLKVVTNPPQEDPSPNSSSNEAIKERMKRESSFHYLSPPESKPERRQRWSLLRSRRHQQKSKKDRTRESASSVTSDDSSPQTTTIDLLPHLKPGESTEALLPTAHGQQQSQPSPDWSTREQAVVGGSLFSKPIAFHSSYHNYDGDWQKSATFSGVGVTHESQRETSPSPPPVFAIPDLNRSSTKVHQLAREYSRKIKDRRDHVATSAIYDEGTSFSQGGQNHPSCRATPLDQQLDWMQLIKVRKTSRQRLTSSPDTLDDDSDSGVLDVGASQSEIQSAHGHSLSTFSEPSSSLTNDVERNTGSFVPPSKAEQKPVRRKSYTNTQVSAVEEALDTLRDGATERMKHAGSENFLSSSYEVPQSSEFDHIRKRTKFGGWVKSLVHKFSSK